MTDVDAAAGNPGGATSAAIAATLPPAIAELAADATWRVLDVAADGSTAWVLARPGADDVLLEAAPAGPATTRLAGARDRLTWLATVDPTLAPAVLAWAVDEDAGDAYLATTAPAGAPAAEVGPLGDVDAFIASLATGLRRFHDLPVAGCPFVLGVNDLVDGVRGRIARGEVDPASVTDLYRRYTPDQLLDNALAARPADPEDVDLVVCHGRPTLDHLRLAAGEVTAYTGLGSLGVGDRYADLAVIARDLAHRVSPHALGPFFDAYGIEWPDVRRLDFHVVLAELR